MKETLKIRRIVRRRRLSSHDRRKLAAARKYYQQHKPSLARLIQERKVDSAIPWGEYLALQDVLQALRSLGRRDGLALPGSRRRLALARKLSSA
jgi:hypothetical protein